MSDYTRLPDAELDIMQIIWSQPSPISSIEVSSLAAPEKNWKPQTVLTLLTRLTKRGYLSSEKLGKERYYTQIVSREEYLAHETGAFMKRLHKNSLTGLMNALYSDRAPQEDELAALEQWLNERK